jgi:sigma-B regulation protein RsbU (phosphoserine phosphatase)
VKLSDSRKYQLLLEISQKVRDTFDMDETLTHILDTIHSVVDYDAAGIFVLNQDLVHGRFEQPRGMIAGISQRGYGSAPAPDDEMINLGKGIVGHVIASRAGVVVADVQQNQHYVQARPQTLSEIAVPILRNDRAIGALNLESDRLSAYDESDLEVLQFFADAASLSIEKAMLHRQLLEKVVMDKQIELARDTQSRLFPDEPPHIPGYDIDGICIPAHEIGGDYYDYFDLPRGRVGVTTADVSGHGISAALLMTGFRGLLRTHVRNRSNPAAIVNTINRLLPEFSGDGGFVTAVYLTLDPVNHVFNYVCCGQQPPLLLHADGSMGSSDLRGPALGILEDVVYTSQTVPILTQDILAIFTDGVVEATNPMDEEFGVERLKEVLHRNRNLPAAELIRRVVEAAREYLGSVEFDDDLTLVIIKRE